MAVKKRKKLPADIIIRFFDSECSDNFASALEENFPNGRCIVNGDTIRIWTEPDTFDDIKNLSEESCYRRQGFSLHTAH